VHTCKRVHVHIPIEPTSAAGCWKRTGEGHGPLDQ